MRKKLLFSALAFATVVFITQPFTAQQTAPPQSDEVPNHERVDSDKAKKMISYFVNNASKKDHNFTKFNREDLIAALQAMPEDTVKFVIGAFTEDGPGRKKGKPVIMLQLLENDKEIPGGNFLMYKYMQGAICPPPNGVCALEQ